MKQFTAIFHRNYLYLIRNPRSLNGILFNGIFSGLLILLLYYKVGEWNESKYIGEENVAEYTRYIYNLKGLAFLLANNISFSSSSAVILQMPL